MEAEGPSPVRRGVVQDDVRAHGESAARRAPFRRLQVEDDGALAAVQGDEVAADPGRDGQDVPVAVTARRLDLDHLRTEVGQKDAAERARDVLGVLDDSHPAQRAGQGHRSPRPRRAITSCWTSAVPPEIVEPTLAP